MVIELVKAIIKALVDHPDDVEVTQIEGGRTRILEVSVHKEDVGKIIGRSGKTADAIRTIVYAASGKEGKHTTFQIND